MTAMNEASLRLLIAQGESETLEFKRSIAEKESAAKTICAMLNGPRGGTILFGVSDDGRIRGLDAGQRTHDLLRGELRKIDPPIALDLETVTMADGRSVIAIVIPGNTGIYRYDGRPYARFGASTSIMPEATYQQYVLERRHSITRWENQRAAHLSLDDLDHQEIHRTVDEAVRNGRLADPGTRDVKALLQGLNLIDEDQLLNAAAVLFGHSQRLPLWYPQCQVRLARFRDTTKTEFVDNRQFVGNVFELLRRTQQFLIEHVPVSGRVVPDRLERIDTPQYPPEAWREALVNAFAHRDYAEGAGSVDVALFDDRLEITSTGGLRFGLTVEDLMREHHSRPWNPLIARVLYLRGMIESWGRGTIRIIEIAEQARLPRPEFEDQRLSFTVRLRAASVPEPTRRPKGLTPLQGQLLDVLREIGPAPLGQIEERIQGDFDRRQIQRALQSLRALGLVELIGARRGSRWMRVLTAEGTGT